MSEEGQFLWGAHCHERVLDCQQNPVEGISLPSCEGLSRGPPGNTNVVVDGLPCTSIRPYVVTAMAETAGHSVSSAGDFTD